MDITQRTLTAMRGLVKRYGPQVLKTRLWDQEFSGTHWDFIDNTLGDCVYPYLEKYLKKGSILDLGCGPGNTANELAEHAYTTYVGVDISEAALLKARKRTEINGRAGKNSFVCSDFLSYRPTQKFDAILFRESMYHVPSGKVKPMLDHFSKYLKEDGTFIVRINTSDGKGGHKQRLKAVLGVVETYFGVVERSHDDYVSEPMILIFRPKQCTA